MTVWLLTFVGLALITQLGGIWLPNDGVVTASDVCNSLAIKAAEQGVQIVEKCKIKEVMTKDNKVSGVITDRGTVKCDFFVNCGGQWAREIGQLSHPHVKVPLHSCEHFYIVTRPLENMELDRMTPVIRDYDGYIYLREWGGGFMAGGFEPEGKAVFSNGIPDKFEFQLLPEDWDHFQILLEEMMHRVPLLGEAEVRQLTNGPESFTPDGKCILGEAPEIGNYFVAAGMNSAGIVMAGGVGKVLSDWIVQGEPLVDCWALDIRRFTHMHNNKKFLRERVKEVLGLRGEWFHPLADFKTGRYMRMSPLFTRLEKKGHFSQVMAYERPVYFEQSNTGVFQFIEGMHQQVGPPSQESFNVTGRNLRTSPLFNRQEGYGAAFGQLAGYERPLWFNDLQHDDTVLEVPTKPTYGKPPWFDKVRTEYWACREGVCIIDMTTFSKFDLRSQGEEVVKFLQYMCSNDIDKGEGSIIHTGMQNHNGGFENDCSLVRLDVNRYFMTGPTAQQTRAYKWLEEHLPPDGSVQLRDITSAYTAINLIGPRAQELLSELTDVSVTKQDFPLMTCKIIDVGQASNIKAMRLTHSGEDGWMLYIPSEYALHVYDSLMSVGKNYGIRNAGYFALRALRIEKFFAYWGAELGPFTTPLECNRDFRVRYEKQQHFIGRGALLKQKTEGIKKRLVQFLVEEHDLDNDLWPWGGEPIYRNDKYVGMTTSAAYGFTLDRHVCLGFVHDFHESGEANILSPDFILKDAKYEIDIAGKRFPVKASVYPPKLAPAEQLFDMRYKTGHV